MENKTAVYILLIVAMVAVVAITSMLVRPHNSIGTSSTNNGITANVVSDEITPVNIGDIGRFLLGVTLIGSCVYMYRKWD